MQLRLKAPIALTPRLLNGAMIGCFFILYAPLLVYWYDGWLNKTIGIEHEYFSHGVIGLPFAAYISWMKRKQWQKLPDSFNPLGAVLLGLGGVFYLSGLSMYVNLSFPILLTGICLYLKGISGFQLQKFPLLFVFLATPNPIPYLIAPYTLPLQRFISATVGFIIMQFGLDVTVDNINIFIEERIVEVAPYCAGLKLLFTAIYVALMLLYWTENIASKTATILLILGTFIISISTNIIRNTLLTFLYGTGRDGLFNWLHQGWGGDLLSAFMLSLVVLLLYGIEKYLLVPIDEG
ncbi:cyanoexosortase B [Aerosakkonema funiforme]|uniref:cyanoexosortase B n=1 Tax=Aerosakkonema funiforme TaxID=1246630 RepID=UPI0035B7B1E6